MAHLGGFHPTFNPIQNIVTKEICHKAWNGAGWVPGNIQESWPKVAGGNPDENSQYDEANAFCAVAINNKHVQVIAIFNDKANGQYPLYYTKGTEA